VENFPRRSFLFLGAAMLAPVLKSRRQAPADEFDFVGIATHEIGQ